MNLKDAARYVNYNFLAQAIMSTLSGTRRRVRIGALDLPFNSHYKDFHKAKIDLKTSKFQNSFSQKMILPVWKGSKKFAEGFKKIAVEITRQHLNTYGVDITFFVGSRPFNTISTKGNIEAITKYLHNKLANYLRPDDAIGSVSLKSIGALPVGLKFTLNGVQFVVGFQYQIDGSIMLDLQTQTGSGLFDLTNKAGRDRATAFITGNANLAFDDKDNAKRAALIIKEISGEVVAATKAAKAKKPRTKYEGGERAPEGFILPRTKPAKKLKITKPTAKKTPEPARPPVALPGTKKKPDTKVSRMNKRGFDVVEKRSVTYTKKSPAAKLTGIGSIKKNDPLFYIDYLNSKKGFTKDRKTFKSYDAAVKWAKANLPNYTPDLIKIGKVNKKPASPAQLAARAKFTKMVKARAAAKKIGANYTPVPEKINGSINPKNWWAGFGKIPKGKINFLMVPTDRIAKKIQEGQLTSFVPRVKVTITRGKHFDNLQTIRTSDQCAKIIRKFFTGSQVETQEYGGALLLSQNMKVMGIYLGFVGGLNSAVIDSRLIFAAALSIGATGIILFHNHPSGTLASSAADRKLTQELKKAGENLQIAVADHIILTKNSYFSMLDNGEI
jgi:hypothetical protein